MSIVVTFVILAVLSALYVWGKEQQEQAKYNKRRDKAARRRANYEKSRRR